MKYHQLTASNKSTKKRVGRGNASGHGTTAGRGTKGQRARTGKKLSATFMGGQLPLVSAIPKKRGFTSKRVPAQVVYLDQLNELKATTIDNSTLAEAGLINSPYHAVKLIMRDSYSGKATVKTQAASASVCKALEKNGGKFEKTATPLQASAKVAKKQ